jgi:lipoate-protein ligase A
VAPRGEVHERQAPGHGNWPNDVLVKGKKIAGSSWSARRKARVSSTSSSGSTILNVELRVLRVALEPM